MIGALGDTRYRHGSLREISDWWKTFHEGPRTGPHFAEALLGEEEGQVAQEP